MIEVNLLPGSRKRRAARAFTMPKFGGGEGGGPNPWIVAAVFAWIAALGYIGYAYTSTIADTEEVAVAIEDALQDSIRFAAQTERIERLRARRDSINERIAIIQEIDQGRFIWAHVMDEVARALPDYTWLTAITATSPEPEPRFTVQGRAGSQIAVAAFMSELEASPFFRGVAANEIVAVMEGPETVQEFSLSVAYVQPPFEDLLSVPLFEDGPAPPTVDTSSAVTGGEEE